jgi:S-adenosylmethionine synthetase
MTAEPTALRPAEYVLPGHPDKLADAIADAIVREAWRRERRALVGVEVALHRDVVFIDGRVACRSARTIDFRALVRRVYADIGYGPLFGPDPRRLKIRTDLCLGPMIKGESKFREVSDDQVISVGYACSTPGTDMLPVEHAIAKRLAGALDALRREQRGLMIGPDGKVIVLVAEHRAEDGRMRWCLEQVTVSMWHSRNWRAVEAHRALTDCIHSEIDAMAAIVPGLWVSPDMDLRINPVGDFIEGGPFGDNGLSGKKLVMDAYGPRVPIGGGATAGKDRWKPDVRGPAFARSIAVEQVLRHGCRECTVTVAINPGDTDFRVASIERR